MTSPQSPFTAKGFFVGAVCSLLVSMCAPYGGNNLGSFAGFAYNWDYLLLWMHNPTEPNLRGWLFTTIGGTIEGLLLMAQKRWFWWPLHPLGFTVAAGWLTSGTGNVITYM